MRTKCGTVLAAAVAVAEAILINRRSSFFATFAFFAAKHQSRVGSFRVERGDAFYTIYTFYTAKTDEGHTPRNAHFSGGSRELC